MNPKRNRHPSAYRAAIKKRAAAWAAYKAAVKADAGIPAAWGIFIKAADRAAAMKRR